MPVSQLIQTEDSRSTYKEGVATIRAHIALSKGYTWKKWQQEAWRSSESMRSKAGQGKRNCCFRQTND